VHPSADKPVQALWLAETLCRCYFKMAMCKMFKVGDEEAIPPDVVLALRMPVYHAVESDRSETRT